MIVLCPACDGDKVRKFGKKQGKQIYRCNDTGCTRTTFRREYAYKAHDPKVRRLIRKLAAGGISGRAIARELSISKDTVSKIKEEK